MRGMRSTLCRYTTDINPNLASLPVSHQQPQWNVFKHHHSGQWLINIINPGVDEMRQFVYFSAQQIKREIDYSSTRDHFCRLFISSSWFSRLH